MDGLLIVDKPIGPTSHDVVARVRRRLGERRIGHTGTLDPAASGVLPLVIGRATRLARFLSADSKVYEAVIRLGFGTDSCDATGEPDGEPFRGALPCSESVELALPAFRGTFLQTPPAFSAKKIDGTRSYQLARRARAASEAPARSPEPVMVTVHELELLDAAEDTVTLRVACSSGFYVRALARDLGAALGVGGHLAALKRTRNGDWTVEGAMPLADIEQDGGREAAIARIVPLSRMLPALSAATLTAEGARRAVNGRDLAPGDFEGLLAASGGRHVRLMTGTGDFLGIAEPAAQGLLHPSVILV